MSAPAKSPQPKVYYSNGQALSSPPLTARIHTLLTDAYSFAGLYFTTLFSTDTVAAAEASPFSTQGRNAVRSGASASSWRGGSGSTGGSGGIRRPGGSSGSGGSFGLNLGGMDQVRTPGCGSCG